MPLKLMSCLYPRTKPREVCGMPAKVDMSILLRSVVCFASYKETIALPPAVHTSRTFQNPDEIISFNFYISTAATALTQRCEEPPVFPALVSLIQRLLDCLLRVLPLRNLLERITRHNTLQSLQLQRVTGRHKVVVVDSLDERLDLATLLLARFRHAACDGGWVALDAGHKGMGKGVGLRAGVDGLDDHDLY